MLDLVLFHMWAHFTNGCSFMDKISERYELKSDSWSFISAVFDDGDEKTLRRSSLCLKGARHFAESEASISLPLSPITASSLLSGEMKLILCINPFISVRIEGKPFCPVVFSPPQTLDRLPLTNPEHFGTPVIGKKGNRGRRSNPMWVSSTGLCAQSRSAHI